MTSVMKDALGFLDNFGMFDVILPFLMIYVMVFALLERTKIFGTEKVGGEEVTKKNLNAIFAFVVAFFTIISARVVTTINRAIGPIMVLLVSIILFLMLASVFQSQDDNYKNTLSKRGKKAFAVFIFVVIGLIFLGSITNDKGETWLNAGWDYITSATNTGHVGAVILLILVMGLIMWVGKDTKEPTEED
jgi:hypothetical protein